MTVAHAGRNISLQARLWLFLLGTWFAASGPDTCHNGFTDPEAVQVWPPDSSNMMPTLYIPHGGGPLPVLGSPCHTAMVTFLRGVHQRIPEKPKAILLISAHWEEKQPQLTSSPNPELLFDYYGFPAETYKYKYPAPGSPSLAEQAADLLRTADFKPELNPNRGLDHGAFIPLMLMYLAADIPVVQLSLLSSLDPEEHYSMGAALAPLRQQGVLLLGSGMSFHGMSTLQQGYGKASIPGRDPATLPGQPFNQWLINACQQAPAERHKSLVNWSLAPGARQAHPREEHLIPLMVAAGAASGHTVNGETDNGGVGHVLWDGDCMGTAVSSYAFGDILDDDLPA
eukprot:GHUV01007921.1.p1 GENE.GHUV01007921.1~~GHUV01007921.1.p1  ORF type:complete len:341 (+),score=74.05 GHUV01007921.1:428-1450(+)